MIDAIRAAGMSPPSHLPMGRFVRFPGVDKGRGNTAGWAKLITPALGIYGDWSSGLSVVWHDGTASKESDAAARTEIARLRAREQALVEKMAAQAAKNAQETILRCKTGTHPYLAQKGFPGEYGLLDGDDLIIPMRNVKTFQIQSYQRIRFDPETRTFSKKFLHGGRAKGAIFCLGANPKNAGEIYYCEGYATGLSIAQALRNMYRKFSVIVCFSAGNIPVVAAQLRRGVVCADNDASQAGMAAAKTTGLPWVMPPKEGCDFNDLHQEAGIFAVEKILRSPMETDTGR